VGEGKYKVKTNPGWDRRESGVAATIKDRRENRKRGKW